MRNREIINRNLELLDGKLGNLRSIVSRQEPLELYYSNINAALEIVENIKSFIEDEEISDYELNK